MARIFNSFEGIYICTKRIKKYLKYSCLTNWVTQTITSHRMNKNQFGLTLHNSLRSSTSFTDIDTQVQNNSTNF